MKNLRLLVSLIVCLILAFSPQAQTSDNCLVHFDKSFYVTGEVVWYKLYLPLDFKDNPISVRVEITDKTGTILHQYFLKSEGETSVHGYYQVPFELNSDVYYLSFTGISKTDKSDVTLATASFPVYNDLKGAAQFTSLPTAKPEITTARLDDLQVSIQLDKTSISQRDKVQATVQVVDKAGNPVAGNFSVAVVDQTLVGAVGLTQTISSGQSIENASLLANDLYLKATVTTEDGNALQANILGAYSNKDQAILYTKSDAAGSMFLKLSDFHNGKNIQFLGYQKEEERLLVKTDKTRSVPKTEPLIFNEALAEYLNLSRQRKKIFQHYGILEMNISPTLYEETTEPLKPNQTFALDEYESFEKVHNFFKEVLSPLRFELQADSTFIARMYDPANKKRNNFFSGQPVFIVDGKVTRDAHYIAIMNTEDIEKVELFFNPKQNNSYFRVFGSNGVVRITTKRPISSLPVFEAQNNIPVYGIQRATEFPAFSPEQLENNRHQPFFRPQLYWNPIIQTDASGKATVTFYQSDALSTFQIKVIAQSETGKYGESTLEYEVKE